MITDVEVQREFGALLSVADLVAGDLGKEVADLLRIGHERPLGRDQATGLLTRAIETIRTRSQARGDTKVASSVDGNVRLLVDKIVAVRDRMRPAGDAGVDGDGGEGTEATPKRPVLRLESKFGVKAGPVHPTPMFHQREFPMEAGFVRTRDLSLWENNERLDLHLSQFRQREGRGPTAEELLDMMLSRLDLGVPDAKDDQFHIQFLARSIAVNGVQKPPILAHDGRLLDGNRRVAACYYILLSDDFDSMAKGRAQEIYVWRLTAHATREQEDAVVVALNFEPDHKEPWPEYVKARKVYDEWQAMLALEPRHPSAARQSEMKRDLSIKFALGPDSYVVGRYLKMVDWAMDFEEYHVGSRDRNEFEVKHVAAKYFQYFDELAKGEKAGVAKTMREDEAYKHLVYDLLFQGKFRSWRDIRELKRAYDNLDARDHLSKAREARDEDEAEDHIENAISIARMKSAEHRTLGANTRIESFVTWLEELPVGAFRDEIRPDVLKKLVAALELVRSAAEGLTNDDDA